MIVGHPDGREGKVGLSRQATASRWSLRKAPAACARLLALWRWSGCARFGIS